MNLSLIPIIGSDEDYRQVEPLYLNTEITRWLRDGKPWDSQKIRRYLSYFRDEDPMLTGFIEYRITIEAETGSSINDRTIGIVGFRTDYSPDDKVYMGRPFVSILVDPQYQGRGIGVTALKMAIVEYQKLFPNQPDIYSYIDNNNLASLQLHQSSKLSESGEDKGIKFYLLRTINNHSLMVYSSSPSSLLPYLVGPNPTPKSDLIRHIVGGIMSGQISFPYSKEYLPPLEMMVQHYQSSVPKTSNKFYHVSGYTSDDKLFLPPQYINSNERSEYYSVVSDHYPDYDRYNGITDYFTEEERITAKKIYAKESTAECWGLVPENENADGSADSSQKDSSCVTKIVTYLLDKYPGYGPRDLRDSIFSESRDPGLFKLMWIRGVLLKLFPTIDTNPNTNPNINPNPNINTNPNINPNPKPRILDISAGWGDRLIASILHGCDYLGFDPNLDLAIKYDQIIATLNGDPNRHRVITQPFEEADLSQEGEFDICLSSPPFFDIEIFSQEENQSIVKFPDFNDWMVGFLFKSLKMVWNALKINGYLAIHMGDTKYHKINEPMLLFIEQYLPRSSYRGTIGLGGDQKSAAAQPLWIWQKMGPQDKLIRWTNPKSPNTTTIESRLLSNKYPDLFNTYLQASSMGYLSRRDPQRFREIFIGVASTYQKTLSQLNPSERVTADQLFRSKLLLIPVYLVSGSEGLSEWIIETVRNSVANIDNVRIQSIVTTFRR